MYDFQIFLGSENNQSCLQRQISLSAKMRRTVKIEEEGTSAVAAQFIYCTFVSTNWERESSALIQRQKIATATVTLNFHSNLVIAIRGKPLFILSLICMFSKYLSCTCYVLKSVQAWAMPQLTNYLLQKSISLLIETNTQNIV